MNANALNLWPRALNRGWSRSAASLCVLLGVTTLGCASTGESGQSDAMTAQVGNYSPPPSNIQMVRVGVPQFKVTASGGFFGGEDLDDLAADQMSSLLHQSRRFTVIERAQLEQLLKEQDMEGIVQPGELARPGEVRGVQYLLLGKVTNFRIKAERIDRGVDVNPQGEVLGDIGQQLGGGVRVNKRDVRVNTEAGVDLRLVDPSTGEIWVSHFGDFKRTDSASAMGLGLGGVNAEGDAEVQLSEDDAGKVLRLALDEALRKMLPEIDQKLVAMAQGGPVLNGSPPSAGPGGAPAAGLGAAPAATAKKFCGSCGAQVTSAEAKFCPSCGASLQ